MQPAVLAAVALLVLVFGCGKSDSERVADNLPEAVKKIDGGTLKDVSCESRETELENSKQWECRGVWSSGPVEEDAVYSVQTSPDGEVTSFVAEE